MIKPETLGERDVGRVVVFDDFQTGKITSWRENRVYVDYGFGVFPTPACQLRFATLIERICGPNFKYFAAVVAAGVLAAVGIAADAVTLKMLSGFMIAALVFKSSISSSELP